MCIFFVSSVSKVVSLTQLLGSCWILFLNSIENKRIFELFLMPDFFTSNELESTFVLMFYYVVNIECICKVHIHI